jgi:hypothetical protein
MIDQNTINTKMTKKIDNNCNPEDEKAKAPLKYKISEESQDQSISQLNTHCSSQMTSPLFPSSNTEASSQQNTSNNNNLILTNFTLQNILSALADKKATKFIQNWLSKEATKQDIDSFVKKLNGFYRFTMKNKNGNYLCKDLIAVCDLQQRIKILKEITKNISEDSTDQFATFPIQTLIKYSSSEEEYKLILDSFDYNSLFFASFDTNGSHVIQDIMEHIPERFRKKFNLLFLQLFCFLSCKKIGVLCAKQFCTYTKDEEMIEKIINLIKPEFLRIATSEFGHHLIQHILEVWKNTDKINKIKEEIISNFIVMSSNKYSITILQSMGFMNPNNVFMNLNFRNNNQNNYINQNQLPITLNNYNNNNIINKKQIHKYRKK